MGSDADPAAAARALERIAAGHGIGDRLADDEALSSALAAVTAASPWLTRILVSDPLAVEVAAGPDDPLPEIPDTSPGSRLRRLKALGLLRVAVRDLLGLDDLEQVGRGLADLAARLLGGAYAASPDAQGMAVIAMGKLGAAELNYASDVDLMLVAPDDGRGQDAPAADGPADGPPDFDARPFLELARAGWRVDLDLRPEGRSGALARSLSSYEIYWSRWAAPWEFQALLKARPVAGDPGLGALFEAAAAARVWARALGAEDLRELRRMKARAEGEVLRRGRAELELKRGPGGIRDIEFAAQLLQLVHGPADPALRRASTLDAIRALAAGGYVDADDAAALDSAYRFLRTVEHRLQLYEGLPSYTLPSSPDRLAHLARVMGYRPEASRGVAEQLLADLRRHRATARTIHERLFFRPLLEAFGAGRTEAVPGPPGSLPSAPVSPVPVSPLRGESGSLPPEAVTARLTAFGFTDAARTRQAVAELTRGFSRVSQLMQQMLPLLLDWLSDAPDPDQGLFGLRTLAGERHSREQLTAVCRESPIGAQQLCRLLGTGPRFAWDLQRQPDALAGLASGSFPGRRDRSELDDRLAGSLAWRSGAGAAELGLRTFVQAERLRIAARDVLGLDDTSGTGRALTDLADSVVAAVLAHVRPAVPMAVIGMGRFGGGELGYGSDLDLLIVYDLRSGEEAAEAAGSAEEAAAAFVRALAGTTPATGIYPVDLALRPEGRQGPTARSLGAYRSDYDRWAQPWERQALLRGRVVAGDPDVGRRFAELAGRFVWDRPFGVDDMREIRRTKARMERERVPAGEDPKYHLKLGPGSLSDVEWTVQLLQLLHGVRAAGTGEALTALQAAGHLSESDAVVLGEAYRFCERTRNRLSLVRDLPGDSLPTTGPALTALARSLGYSAPDLRNEYARLTRRARRVVERLFYGTGA